MDFKVLFYVGSPIVLEGTYYILNRGVVLVQMVGDPPLFIADHFVQIYNIQAVTVRYFLVSNTI